MREKSSPEASPSRLDAATGTAQVTTTKNDRLNVMVIERDPGEWFVGDIMAAVSGPPPFGWVQRIDAETLAPVATSPELPCGEHVCCGDGCHPDRPFQGHGGPASAGNKL